MHTTDLGSFAIVTETADRRMVERELRRLDRNLFVDFEAHPEHGLIPLVCEHIGSGLRPQVVLRWQEPDGRPKPLCQAMVEQVKRQEGAAGRSVGEALAHNEGIRQGLRDRADSDYGTIERDHRKRIRAAELDSLPPFWRPKHFGKR